MKERPILFSAPMVRAILAGQKTQTRRIVRLPAGCGVGKYTTDGDAQPHEYVVSEPDGDPGPALRCPYGAPGYGLWVKETWCVGYAFDAIKPSDLRRDVPVWYRMDAGNDSVNQGRWRPSIFMPRWASRINLTVTGIRVERLHDITEADARAEGMDWAAPQYLDSRDEGPDEDPREVGYARAGASFALDNYRRLWDQINGPGAWDLNPWVWVVSFEVRR